MPGREAVEEGSAFFGDRVCSNGYQEWLRSIVAGDRYSILLQTLHGIEFRWIADYDENRAADGINLRYRFYTENELPYYKEVEDYPCSVLEMMVSLAMMMENSLMYDCKKGDRTADWFWMMLENLGIVYSDAEFRGPTRKQIAMKADITSTVENMINRNYDSHGHGSLFPVEKSSVDMRNVELWYQANIYASEVLL